MVNTRLAPGQLGLARLVAQFCCSPQSPVVVIEGQFVLTLSPIHSSQSLQGRDSKVQPGALVSQSKAVAENLTREFIHPLSLTGYTQITCGDGRASRSLVLFAVSRLRVKSWVALAKSA